MNIQSRYNFPQSDVRTSHDSCTQLLPWSEIITLWRNTFSLWFCHIYLSAVEANHFSAAHREFLRHHILKTIKDACRSISLLISGCFRTMQKANVCENSSADLGKQDGSRMFRLSSAQCAGDVTCFCFLTANAINQINRIVLEIVRTLQIVKSALIPGCNYSIFYSAQTSNALSRRNTYGLLSALEQYSNDLPLTTQWS